MLRTIRDNDCNDHFNPVNVPTSVVCAEQAWFEHSSTGTQPGMSCNGDSGGFVGRPRSAGEAWTVDGIVSFGDPGCDRDLIGGYTEVALYRYWINQMTGL